MTASRATALLVGRGLVNSSKLVERLVARRWNCESACSYGEALALLNTGCIALLLSEFHLPDGSAHRLIPWLEGSETTAYFSIQTGSVTWWLPALDRGRACFGAAALRPGEFGRWLEETLQERLCSGEQNSLAKVQPIDSSTYSIAVR